MSSRVAASSLKENIKDVSKLRTGSKTKKKVRNDHFNDIFYEMPIDKHILSTRREATTTVSSTSMSSKRLQMISSSINRFTDSPRMSIKESMAPSSSAPSTSSTRVAASLDQNREAEFEALNHELLNFSLTSHCNNIPPNLTMCLESLKANAPVASDDYDFITNINGRINILQEEDEEKKESVAYRFSNDTPLVGNSFVDEDDQQQNYDHDLM